MCSGTSKTMLVMPLFNAPWLHQRASGNVQEYLIPLADVFMTGPQKQCRESLIDEEVNRVLFIFAFYMEQNFEIFFPFHYFLDKWSK